MRDTLAKLSAAVFLAAALSGAAQAQNPREHMITVSGNGQVIARPDLGILVLVVQASAPLAADAVREDTRRARDVRSALTALGYGADASEVSPVVFTRAGGPYYGPNQPSITGVQAEQFIYVFFGSNQIKDQARLSQNIATVIDALTKAGASPANPYPQQEASMVAYTVKDPAQYERQALDQALAHGHETAQAIAKKMGVEITGLSSISTGFVGGVGGAIGGPIGPYPQVPSNPLAELPYRFYSTRADQVAIGANARLNYDFK